MSPFLKKLMLGRGEKQKLQLPGKNAGKPQEVPIQETPREGRPGALVPGPGRGAFLYSQSEGLLRGMCWVGGGQEDSGSPPAPARTRLSTQPGRGPPSLSALCPNVVTQQRLAALRCLCYKRLVERSISRESWAELVQVSSEVPAQDDPSWGRVGHSQNRQESRMLPPCRPWTELPGAGGREVHQEKILDCPRAPCSPWLCDPRPEVPTDPEEEAAAPWGDTGAGLEVQSQARDCHPLRTLACSLCPQS